MILSGIDMLLGCRFAGLLAAAYFAAAASGADEFHLIRSLSGPSGKVEGSRFVFDQVRNRFVYPQDKSLIVYFEWEGPPGSHVLTAFWRQPDGRTAAISPDVKIESATRQLNSYWTFIIADHPGSILFSVSGSAIKRITAGVKARNWLSLPRLLRRPAFTLLVHSLSNEKKKTAFGGLTATLLRIARYKGTSRQSGSLLRGISLALRRRCAPFLRISFANLTQAGAVDVLIPRNCL
jgi:hypothetical protein